MTAKNYSTAAANTVSFKSVGQKITDYNQRIEKTQVIVQNPIGIKTPIQLNNGSLFSMHYKLSDQITDNLRNLIMTNKGERLGNPAFGTDLRKTQYNTANKEDAEIEMMAKIQNAVKIFMPFVQLENFTTTQLPPSMVTSTTDDWSGFAGGALSINVTYSVPQISTVQKGLTILIPMGV
jgi:phage baseplate assembly protein W